MLSWLFKKRRGLVASGAGTVLQAPEPVERKLPQAEAARAEWVAQLAAQLAAAKGDDDALLRLALTAAPLDIRSAAVAALHSEDALKRAERALRGHDSRVHRAAKLRWVAAVAQREARARAHALIDTATGLAAEALPAANHLVALDRDWQALDANLISADQHAAFTELRGRLDATVQALGEQQQRVHRWRIEAGQARAGLQPGATEDADTMAQRCEAAAALRAARPEVPATAALDQALQAAIEAAQQAATRAAEAHQSALAAQAVAMAMALDTAAAEPAAITAAPTRPALTNSPEQRRQFDALIDDLMNRAEAALAAGRVAELQHHLRDVDTALHGTIAATLSDSTRARRQALHIEQARLRDWQQWGGAQAIDALLAQADALAALTLAAADPQASAAPKLHLKTHAASIQALRLRWGETGRAGATVDPSRWQRFDAALQTAHAPVAAQQALLKAARHDNLRARQALLDALDAVPAPAATSDMGPDATPAEAIPPDWKERLRALGDFQLAWRQLGPVEHTVPASARAALAQRQHASLERIEAPLREARREAEALREQLIVRADVLAADVVRNPALRDAAPRVRELQAEWQHQARRLPLARAAEGALWARFKAATDAAFAQREAAFNARDVELAANLAAREALLARLSASAAAADAGADDVWRTLGEIDRAWRQPMELPGAAAGSIDARFRSARAAVVQALEHRERRRWQARCDTLAARLGLCDEREAAAPGGPDLTDRWASLDALPVAWQQALDQRWSQPVAPGPLTESAMEDLLLQLEAALNLPATPELQAARRGLKLRALKEALEGRAAHEANPETQRTQWLAAALRQGVPGAAYAQRLRAVITALRRVPSGPDVADMPSR